MTKYGTKYKLGYSTYHGGSQEDEPAQLLFDDSHHLWVIGRFQSVDFPLLEVQHFKPRILVNMAQSQEI
ncbi:MAG: hypothetical protein ACFFD4_14245 [Candidatus Odinarchaeota archaeon]